MLAPFEGAASGRNRTQSSIARGPRRSAKASNLGRKLVLSCIEARANDRGRADRGPGGDAGSHENVDQSSANSANVQHPPCPLLQNFDRNGARPHLRQRGENGDRMSTDTCNRLHVRRNHWLRLTCRRLQVSVLIRSPFSPLCRRWGLAPLRSKFWRRGHGGCWTLAEFAELWSTFSWLPASPPGPRSARPRSLARASMHDRTSLRPRLLAFALRRGPRAMLDWVRLRPLAAPSNGASMTRRRA